MSSTLLMLIALKLCLIFGFPSARGKSQGFSLPADRFPKVGVFGPRGGQSPEHVGRATWIPRKFGGPLKSVRHEE